MMFQEDYKKAYDEIKAENSSVNEIFARAEEKRGYKKKGMQWKRVVVALLTVVTLFAGMSISAIAKEHTEKLNLYEAGIIDYTTYKSWQRNKYSMKVAIPENASVSRDGVVVTAEAVLFDKREFVIIYSLANEEGHDLIREDEGGEYDWYDVSVSLDGEPLVVHHTKFWKYDKETEKAYYKFTAYRDTARYPEGEMVSLHIKGRFKTIDQEEPIDLSNVVLEADTRIVKLHSSRVNEDFVKLENDDFPYMGSVLNMTPLSEIQPDKTVITGIAYMDGVLRVQLCQPDNSVYENSYQRAFITAFHKDGNSINPDEQIIWYEKVNGELVEFREEYYLISETQIKELSMKMKNTYLKGNINTVWDVEFEVPR